MEIQRENENLKENQIEIITNSIIFRCGIHFIFNLIHILKGIYFLCKIFLIFMLETIYYLIYRDYKKFIFNISTKLAKDNILYVKIFQAFAFNNKLIDETINNEIIKFTNSVPYNDDDIDWKTFYKITSKYGLNDQNSYPINSGMISLVFKLPIITEENGPEFLILKMKRNNIDKKLQESIENFKDILYIISFIPFLNNLEIQRLFEKNINSLKEQLDFKKEINNTLEMKNICKINDFIEIPNIYQEITDYFPNAILMEYIDGKHIQDIDKNDYYEFSKLIFKYGCISIASHGIFHGDLHSGNILFIKNDQNSILPKYQIGVIDFGIVMKISEENRKGFLKFLSELFISNTYDLARIIFDLLLEPKEIIKNLDDHHKNNILSIIENLIKPFINKNKKLDQTIFFDFILHFNDYLTSQKLKEYKITVNDEFIKLQMGIGMAYAITISLCKDDIMGIAGEVLNEIFHLDIMEKLLDNDSDSDSDSDS